MGMSTDLTGDGKTVLKLHYGQFWVYPGTNFTSAFNPNPSGWSQTYAWTNDANANGRWDPGEEGRLIGVSGGSTSTRLDPGIENTYVRQASAYIEREVAPDVGVRTGMVLNAKRQPVARSTSAGRSVRYPVPVAAVDPGPDGRLGSADDGETLTAYDLTAASLSASPVNLTTTLSDSDSEYDTWEITATKRQRTGWSLLASFTENVQLRGRAWNGSLFHAECPDQHRARPGSLQDVASETERHDESGLGLSGLPRRATPAAQRPRAPSFKRSTIGARPSKRNRSRPIGRLTSRSSTCAPRKRFASTLCVSWDSSTCTTCSTPMLNRRSPPHRAARGCGRP